MYYQLFSRFLNPLYEKIIKRRKILEYRAAVDDTQWLKTEEVRQRQWQDIIKLLEHASQNVPYWQEVFKQSNLTLDQIKTYQDFLRLPIIEKDDIRTSKEDMIASNYQGKTWTKSTGGSTGVPLELDYTPESYDWRVAVSKRGYSWAGCEDGIKQAYIWGVDIGKIGPMQKFKEALHHTMLRQKFFNCFQFSDKEMAQCLKSLNQYRPQVIIGYTNPLYNFVQYVKKNGGLKFKVKSVITAAEKLHDFQRKEISEVLGCPVFNTYGSREFMLIASECEHHKGLHINSENLFVEVIKEDGSPAKPGEMGELVITDLHNYGMPFIRYRIGDMAIQSDRVCECGRGLPLLEDVVGRSLDLLITPSGRYVPGEFFPHLMKEFKGVSRFQVIQEKLDRIVIKIIRNDLFKDTDHEKMIAEIRKIFDLSVNIDVQFVNEIPLTKTGKFRVTISKLKGSLAS